MFLASSDNLQLSEASLFSFRSSLNAPVVHVDGLPVDAARAGIVVYAEDYGDMSLAVAMRSVETGESVLFRYRTRLSDVSKVPKALDEALAFAEGFGFLFDDDMLDSGASGSRRIALGQWNALLAPVPSPADSNSGLAVTLGEDGLESDEMLLGDEDVLPPLSDAELGLDEQVVRPGVAQPIAAAVEPEELLLGASELGEPEMILDVTASETGSKAAEPADLEYLDEIPGDELGFADGALDELIALAGEESGDEAPGADAPAVGEPAVAHLQLSKFRQGGQGRAPRAPRAARGGDQTARDVGDDDAAGNTLGRIGIVRVPKQTEDGRASDLTRLLGSF